MKKKALILAGGSGKRFWPLSEKAVPKQLLSLLSPLTLIEETLQRLSGYLETKDIYIVTHRALAESFRRLCPGFPAENIWTEPEPRNTAPSLFWAISRLECEDPENVVGIFPADHNITDTDLFLRRMETAFALADGTRDLITFGILPTSPETGYGYIETPEGSRFSDQTPSLPILSFKEKPDRKTAEEYLRKGNYFWNSGMFVWKASTFHQQLALYSPELFPFYARMLAGEPADRVFPEIPRDSIDYALLEKSKAIRLVPGAFGWSDVGSFLSLHNLLPKDEAGNSRREGDVLFHKSQNNFVFAQGMEVALLGVENLFVVVKNGKIAIGRLDLCQEIKEAYDRFEKP